MKPDYTNELITAYFEESRCNETPADWVIDCIDDLDTPRRDRLIELINASIHDKWQRINRNLERLGLVYQVVAVPNGDGEITLYCEEWTGFANIKQLDESLQYMDRHKYNMGQIADICGFVDHHGA